MQKDRLDSCKFVQQTWPKGAQVKGLEIQKIKAKRQEEVAT